MDAAAQIHEIAQEVGVWRDAGCICIRTSNPHGDPVELSDEEAVELAETLLRLAGQTRPV